MAILRFEQINKEHSFVGGKAFHLANLSQQNFPVPQGIIITEKLEEGDFEEICTWWKNIGSPLLAARSSAKDEDGSDYSFAGQNSSFLNIKDEAGLKGAIEKCFDSINKTSSKAYRELFVKSNGKAKMNVLIQEMVQPKFAGVYFSVDPRNQNQGDVVEYVEGLGEALVSGEVTPFQVLAGKPKGDEHKDWTSTCTKELRDLGFAVRDYLEKDVDMEWAIDDQFKLFLLQARPVTAKFESKEADVEVQKELERLKRDFSSDTFWDGQTFSEWVGQPSRLSFSIFEEAFSNDFAYGDALKRLGYLSFKATSKPQESILDLVFGRAYINLHKLKPLFFGPIPYELKSTPRPHLEFNWRLIDFKTLIRTPISIAKMMKVAWVLSSKRSEWLSDCSKELGKLLDRMSRPLNPDLYKSWTDEELLRRFSKETHGFAKHHLLWPFILTVLIESTYKSLLTISSSVLGKEKADQKIKDWMTTGIHTITYDMNKYYEKACRDPKLRPFFMSRYGHRGPGELDLKNPRWLEMGSKTFADKTKSVEEPEKHFDDELVAKEIEELKSFKKTIILQEWKLLKSMLELRERWKMEILKPFASIRFISQELASRSGLEKDFYYLSKSEIIDNKICNKNLSEEILKTIEERKAKRKAFKLYSFPAIASLKQMERTINGEDLLPLGVNLHGEPVSPGLAFGTVKVVRNFEDVILDELPDDVIVVAETTDPGWTPIFSKSKGLIVERGGILSHSAIVAREMGIPAVSSVMGCVNQFKDGDRVCVDGNSGRITYE